MQGGKTKKNVYFSLVLENKRLMIKKNLLSLKSLFFWFSGMIFTVFHFSLKDGMLALYYKGILGWFRVGADGVKDNRQ